MIFRSLDIDIHSSKKYLQQTIHAGTRTVKITHLPIPPTAIPAIHDSPSYAVHRTQYPSSTRGTENTHRLSVSIPPVCQPAFATELHEGFDGSTQRSVLMFRARLGGNVEGAKRSFSKNVEGLRGDTSGSSRTVVTAYCHPSNPFSISTSRQRRGVPAIPSLVAHLRRAPGDELSASPVMSEVTNENEKRSS